MLYNKNELPNMAYTAGKITILTALAGVTVFMMAFLFDFGAHELSRVSAQTATTSLTVLNTPPSFTLNPYEIGGSSTTTPTNSGAVVQWGAIATDANGADYYLLVCSSIASPTPNASAAPTCGGGVTWGVSTAISSGAFATVSTTTAEWGTGQFAEQNTWYAWVCDADPIDPRCSIYAEQGDYATSSSPFYVNNRPVLTDFDNDGPADPGATINFYSTSTDPDTLDAEDNVYLVVCQSNTGIDPVARTCNAADDLASTTATVTSDAGGSYTLNAITQDDVYPAYGYLVDEHGHTASANPIQQNFTVNNVAPTVLGGDIDLNGGLDINLIVEGGETTGFTLDFTVRDANSCENASAGDEIVGYNLSVFRSGVTSATCDASAGSYDPNSCYPSGVGAATWNLSCTASSTSCTGPTDDTQIFECTFPLWFVADPTDGVSSPYTGQNWLAAVAGVDDNAAFGSLVDTTSPVDLISLTAIDLITASIPYGSLAPGDSTPTLSASTTVYSVGNTGIDQEAVGSSMCGTYTVPTPCPGSATSTIPENQQRFASTSLAYGSPLAAILSSTTPTQIELDVPKSTSTSTPNQGITYWGISVPISITLAGSYQGLNTFTAVTDEFWQ